MILCCARWFEEVKTNKNNMEIYILKSCRNYRVNESDACAEEILNLVLDKDFALKCLLLHLMKHFTEKILSFYGITYYTSSQNNISIVR